MKSRQTLHYCVLDEEMKEECTSRLEYITTNNEELGVKYTTVTEKEKNIVVKAIGLRQGHWFKCPKGKVNAQFRFEVGNFKMKFTKRFACN